MRQTLRARSCTDLVYPRFAARRQHRDQTLAALDAGHGQRRDVALDGADGVINLAGEPIAERKWTQTQRRRIEKSRIDATHSLVQACAKAKQRPQFLINASAVGYYGPHGDEMITEEITPGD